MVSGSQAGGRSQAGVTHSEWGLMGIGRGLKLYRAVGKVPFYEAKYPNSNCSQVSNLCISLHVILEINTMMWVRVDSVKCDHPTYKYVV